MPSISEPSAITGLPRCRRWPPTRWGCRRTPRWTLNPYFSSMPVRYFEVSTSCMPSSPKLNTESTISCASLPISSTPRTASAFWAVSLAFSCANAGLAVRISSTVNTVTTTRVIGVLQSRDEPILPAIGGAGDRWSDELAIGDSPLSRLAMGTVPGDNRRQGTVPSRIGAHSTGVQFVTMRSRHHRPVRTSSWPCCSGSRPLWSGGPALGQAPAATRLRRRAPDRRDRRPRRGQRGHRRQQRADHRGRPRRPGARAARCQPPEPGRQDRHAGAGRRARAHLDGTRRADQSAARQGVLRRQRGPQHGPRQHRRPVHGPERGHPGRGAAAHGRARHHGTGTGANRRPVLGDHAPPRRARRSRSWPPRRSTSSRSGSTIATASSRSSRRSSTGP